MCRLPYGDIAVQVQWERPGWTWGVVPRQIIQDGVRATPCWSGTSKPMSL